MRKNLARIIHKFQILSRWEEDFIHAIQAGLKTGLN